MMMNTLAQKSQSNFSDRKKMYDQYYGDQSGYYDDNNGYYNDYSNNYWNSGYSNQQSYYTPSYQNNYYSNRTLNVLGGELMSCSMNPVTGYHRNGYCSSDSSDSCGHFVCARMTQEYLNYTKYYGSDLATPRSHFPGLRPGDSWCLCASRWAEAYRAGVAPPINLHATHINALDHIRPYGLGLEDLKRSGYYY